MASGTGTGEGENDSTEATGRSAVQPLGGVDGDGGAGEQTPGHPSGGDSAQCRQVLDLYERYGDF